MNLHKNALLFLFFAVFIYVAKAQVPPQYQAGYNQMMKRNSEMMMHNRMLSQQNLALWQLFKNNKYAFIVLSKDSTELSINSKMHWDDTRQQFYLLFTDKNIPRTDSNRVRKIYSNETLGITRLDEDGNAMVYGIAADSCWLFRVVSGAISIYSSMPEIEKIKSDHFVAFRFDNGNIQLFDPNELEPILKDDEKAYKIFKRKDYLSAIRQYNKNHAY